MIPRVKRGCMSFISKSEERGRKRKKNNTKWKLVKKFTGEEYVLFSCLHASSLPATDLSTRICSSWFMIHDKFPDVISKWKRKGQRYQCLFVFFNLFIFISLCQRKSLAGLFFLRCLARWSKAWMCVAADWLWTKSLVHDKSRSHLLEFKCL